MQNAIIAWDNYADTAAIFPSSEVSSLPGDNLTNPQLSKPWRSAVAGTVHLLIDVQDVKHVDVLALMAINLSPTGTLRVRASNSDPDALTGLVYDSGTFNPNVDARFKMACHVIPSGGKNAQYWRITLTDNGVDYLEAGRLFIGPAWQPSTNYSYGWRKGITDLSKRNRTRGGQVYVDSNRQYRYFACTFDYLSEAEAEEGLLEMDRIIGLRGDVLVMLDPENTTNPGKDSLWGQLSELAPISNPQFGIYQKSIQIEERL